MSESGQTIWYSRQYFKYSLEDVLSANAQKKMRKNESKIFFKRIEINSKSSVITKVFCAYWMHKKTVVTCVRITAFGEHFSKVSNPFVWIHAYKHLKIQTPIVRTHTHHMEHTVFWFVIPFYDGSLAAAFYYSTKLFAVHFYLHHFMRSHFGIYGLVCIWVVLCR